MSTAKSLQKPKILGVEGSLVRIQHPEVNNYIKTYLGAQIAAAGTSLTVLDNSGFSDDDWFIIGDVGDEKTEDVDVNGAVTRGTALTITNTNKFAHEVDAPATRIYERGIKIYGASTDGGAGTLLASIDAFAASGTQLADAKMIQWNKPYTEHSLITTDTAYSYYFVKFTDGTTDSDASDYVINTGLAANTAASIIQAALDNTGAQVKDTGEITWPFLIRAVQEWQDYVTQWIDPRTKVKKDWSFEFIDDNTTIPLVTYENRYLLSALTYEMKYGETKQSVLNIQIGKYPAEYIPIDVFDRTLEGKVYSQTSGSTSSGSTSLVLEDTALFDSSGTIYVSGQTITYTGNSSNTLTGIPASSTGSITATIASGATVWQNSFAGRPYFWTIYNGYLLFTIPPSTAYSGWPLKFKYIKKLTRMTEISDVTEIPFYNTAQYYVSYKIEMKRGNTASAANYKLLCDQGIDSNCSSDKAYTTESYNYYRVKNGMSLQNGRNQNWNSDVTYYNG